MTPALISEARRQSIFAVRRAVLDRRSFSNVAGLYATPI